MDDGDDGWGEPVSIDDVPGIEMNQVGRIAAAASSVEFALFACLTRLSGVTNIRVAFALFGGQQFEPALRLTKRVLAELRREHRADAGPQWDAPLKAAKLAMDRRGVLMHSNWVGSLSDGGRQKGTAGFQPWRTMHRESDPEIFTAERLLALGNELERAANALYELEQQIGTVAT